MRQQDEDRFKLLDDEQLRLLRLVAAPQLSSILFGDLGFKEPIRLRDMENHTEIWMHNVMEAGIQGDMEGFVGVRARLPKP